MTDEHRNYENECGDHGGVNSSGAPCGRPAGWGTDFSDGKCKHHRGTNADGSSHDGNQNAMKTGVRSDPVNLFEWCTENDPDGLAYIFSKLHDYAEVSPREVFVVDVTDADGFEEASAALTAHGDNMLLLCIRDYARWRATKRQLVEGIITTQTRDGEHGTYQVDDSNPVNLDLDRLDRTTMKMQDKLGLLPDTGADVEVSVTAQMWDDLTGYYDDD